jgi:hypothetical protein
MDPDPNLMNTFVSETSKILILREKFNINFLPVSRDL